MRHALMFFLASTVGAESPGYIPSYDEGELDKLIAMDDALEALLQSVKVVGGPATCFDGEIVHGSRVSVNHTVYISDRSSVGTPGLMVDSSHESAAAASPFTFDVGRGQLATGWDVVMLGHCAGQQLEFVLEPLLLHGGRGRGSAPEGASLAFSVKVLRVQRQPSMFDAIDADGDRKITKDEMRGWAGGMGSGGYEGVLDNAAAGGIQGMWARLDVNQDETISWEEFDGPKGLTSSERSKKGEEPSRKRNGGLGLQGHGVVHDEM